MNEILKKDFKARNLYFQKLIRFFEFMSLVIFTYRKRAEKDEKIFLIL